jgi:hypothetical protein
MFCGIKDGGEKKSRAVHFSVDKWGPMALQRDISKGNQARLREIRQMAQESLPIQVFVRPSNTNAGGGYWIVANGHHFECKWYEAAPVLEALNTKGRAAAWKAYRKVVKARVNGVNHLLAA